MRAAPKPELEADAEPQLNVPRRSFSSQSTESAAARISSVEQPKTGWIEPLIVIEHVRKNSLELQIDALRYPDDLLDAEVHIPVGQAIENACATIPAIQAQNRIPPIHRLGGAVLENVDWITGRGRVVVCMPVRPNWTNRYGVLVAEEVVVVAGAELFAVSSVGINLDRSARTRGKDRGE